MRLRGFVGQSLSAMCPELSFWDPGSALKQEPELLIPQAGLELGPGVHRLNNPLREARPLFLAPLSTVPLKPRALKLLWSF